MGLSDKKRPRERKATAHISSLATPDYLVSVSQRLGELAMRMGQLEHRHDRIVSFLIESHPNFPPEFHGEIIGVNPILRSATRVSLASLSEQLDVLSTRMERLEAKLNRIFAFIHETNFAIPQELLG